MSNSGAREAPEEEPPPAGFDEAAATRSLRRTAWLIGVPLTLSLVAPFGTRDDRFSWDLAERADHGGFVLLPLCGVLFLAAAAARRWTYTRRALVLGVGGVAALGLGLSLLSNHGMQQLFRPLRNMWVTGTYLFIGCWVAAVAAEIAMHLRPRSRALSVVALLGWVALLLSFCIPMDSRIDFDESLLGGSLRAMNRGYSNSFVPMMLLSVPALCGFLGIVQAARRMGANRDVAATRRFRTSWLAYLLVPVPMLAGAALAIVSSLDDFDDLLSIHNSFALSFGTLFGGAVGIAHLLSVLSAPDAQQVRTWVGRGLAAVAAFVIVVPLVKAILPDGRDGRIAELQWEMAEAVANALEGQPVESRFLGGYEEFDLRAAPGVVELDRGAELEPLLIALRISAFGDARVYAHIVVLPDGSVSWLPRSRDHASSVHAFTLEQASPVLLDMLSRSIDGASSPTCLPTLDEAQAEITPAIRTLMGSGAELCESFASSSSNRAQRFRDVSEEFTGSVDHYFVILKKPDGEQVAVEGDLRTDTGRLWIGNPSLVD